jgi:hypothetical protein
MASAVGVRQRMEAAIERSIIITVVVAAMARGCTVHRSITRR